MRRMENKQLLLSICIPTNGKVEWVIPVIESIYSQGVDDSQFEVVVTDNGEKNDLCEAVKRYSNYNFKYFKTTSSGFTNQIDAFEKCSGLFCKMLNHRSVMMPGSLEALLELINKYKETKPIIYCAEGHAKGDEFVECSNTDDFVHSLGVWTSWSCGTGAWKKDLYNIRGKKIDMMFPHQVFLFGLREEIDSKYIIWNRAYERMLSEEGKGGYNLFNTFGVGFLDLINDLRIKGRITESTFLYVKKELFDFLRGLYVSEVLLPTKRSFIIKDISTSMAVYYGYYYYCKLVIGAWLRLPWAFCRYFFSKIYNSFNKD